MRMMIKFRFPTESGNELLKSGKIEKTLPGIMEDLKPEAAYFYSDHGYRAGLYIVEMTEGSQVLEFGERLWFGLGGEVEMVPVMTPEDIQKGLPSVPEIAKKYG